MSSISHIQYVTDVPRPQSSSPGLTITRPPDYSGFLRNPVKNSTLNEISHSVSAVPLLQISPVQASNSYQNNSETNRTLTKTTLVSTTKPTTFPTEVDRQQERCDMKSCKVLQTARIKIYLTIWIRVVLKCYLQKYFLSLLISLSYYRRFILL